MFPTLSHLAAELDAGRTTSAELTEQALARIADANGEGARVFTSVYADQARAAARAADALRAAGLRRSPIDGVPVSVKDLFDVAGETTTAGSVVLRGKPAARANAVAVQHLINAGAVVMGKTNMTEFAYSGLGINPHYGTPQNAWQRGVDGGRIPGGSSSGAAISVTDGMAFAAVGSDTGGSVRIPSALNGLTGFKPTAARVSMQGVLPLSEYLDSIGPLAASVECCAIMDAVLAGEACVGPIVPSAYPLRGLRLLAPTNVVLDGMDEQVGAAYQAALAKLSAAGAVIVEQAVPAFGELAAINAKGGFTAAEAYAWHRGLIAENKDGYDQRVVSRILRGKEMGAADLLDVIHARRAWIANTEAQLHGFDAVVMPTVPVVAPRIADLLASDEAYYGANGAILRNPTLINFLDGCAVSLPCHAPGGAPVGLSLAAPGGHDKRILSIALAVEGLLAA